MDERLNAIEEIIRQAQEKGEFANLVGQGRPLSLQENLFAADSQLAHSLIHNNGFTLPWIADKQEIIAELDRWRQKLGAAWRQRHHGPAWEQHWQDSQVAFENEAHKLNQRILTYNLKVPADSQQLLPIVVEAELARAQQTPPAAASSSAPQPIREAVPTPGLRERALGYIRSLRRGNKAETPT